MLSLFGHPLVFENDLFLCFLSIYLLGHVCPWRDQRGHQWITLIVTLALNMLKMMI